MHVTLRQLSVFESVARNLSYTKASQELHLSQPAVSMQVRQLEDEVGLPLFEKLGKQSIAHFRSASARMRGSRRSISVPCMPDRKPRDTRTGNKRYPLLSAVELPADLRRLPQDRLPELAQELRSFLIDSVSRTGGHLAAGLGVVDLTIALHYVFDTPEDRLVWDVGHQAYPHKILTGRRDRMGGMRQKGGLSGFPKRSESDYDTFGVGHSSTSISAALGMAMAAKTKGESRHVIAVIGDGALSAGMAFEALNHAGPLDPDLMVILNDNDMSISPPVGAISSHLARLLSGKLYTSVREGSKSALRGLPQLKELMGRWEEHMKGMVMPSTLFEELGFNYIGPIDGHDIEYLVSHPAQHEDHAGAAPAACGDPERARATSRRRASPSPITA